MDIPNIGFNHEKSANAELEILPLSDLYGGKTHDHDPQMAHRVSFYMIICIEQGNGSHMVDFIQYPFDSGTLIFLQPDQVHAFDFAKQPTGYVVLFTQTFLDRVHTNMRLPNYTPTHLSQQHSPLLKLNKHSQARVINAINEMEIEIAHPQSDPLIVMYLFSSLALGLHRLRPELRHDNINPEQSIKLGTFYKLLQSHFLTIRDANWYANKLHTTYKTLNSICKLSTGLTAKQMIDAFTLIEIKRRLVISNITTQKLAYDFSFDDASNFVKYFKKHTGVTPSQFQTAHSKAIL
ncbi:AraC family transcriptional regulator [Pseudoalteromonas sp. C12FD-1]|uniref:AraC family transcriptional regulator n=1 Tax=Pseudoalteromonas sp. C12FD-1 TaxID=3131979 RepID=UPI00307EC201